MRHYLIRKSVFRAGGDSPLTENGIWQAEQAGSTLQRKVFLLMLSTLLRKRATDTAKIVAPDYSVTSSRGIKEMNFGSLKLNQSTSLPKHRPGFTIL